MAGNTCLIFCSPKLQHKRKTNLVQEEIRGNQYIRLDPGGRGYKRLLQWSGMGDEGETGASSGG